MAYDKEFTEGFDKYGAAGSLDIQALLVIGEWSALTASGAGGSGAQVVAPLSGTGQALYCLSSGGGSVFNLRKNVSGNYQRCIGGVTFNSDLLAGKNWGFVFGDSVTDQCSITINATTGAFSFRLGGIYGTALGTTTQTVGAGSTHVLEWDITVDNTVGKAKFWLDGVLTSLNLTGLDSAVTANNYFNYFSIVCTGTGGTACIFDHLYLRFFLATGGADTPILTNPVVYTQFGVSDSVSDFTPVVGILGPAYRRTGNTNAPAAGSLVLKKFVAEVSSTMNSVSFIPGATSATAKYKAVIYNDSAGAPNTLLSSGIEITGVTSGVQATALLVTPQALAPGTTYWIGFINDTSVALQQHSTTTDGYRAANTYASGAPGTAPAMTANQAGWLIFGNLTGMVDNFAQVNEAAPYSGSYNQSANVGDEDLYNFDPIVGTVGNIYTVGVKADVAKLSSGTRTLDLRSKSGSTSSSGDTTGISPIVTQTYIASYFKVNPDTGLPWTQAELAASKHGIKVAS